MKGAICALLWLAVASISAGLTSAIQVMPHIGKPYDILLLLDVSKDICLLYKSKALDMVVDVMNGLSTLGYDDVMYAAVATGQRQVILSDFVTDSSSIISKMKNLECYYNMEYGHELASVGYIAHYGRKNNVFARDGCKNPAHCSINWRAGSKKLIIYFSPENEAQIRSYITEHVRESLPANVGVQIPGDQYYTFIGGKTNKLKEQLAEQKEIKYMSNSMAMFTSGIPTYGTFYTVGNERVVASIFMDPLYITSILRKFVSPRSRDPGRAHIIPEVRIGFSSEVVYVSSEAVAMAKESRKDNTTFYTGTITLKKDTIQTSTAGQATSTALVSEANSKSDIKNHTLSVYDRPLEEINADTGYTYKNFHINDDVFGLTYTNVYNQARAVARSLVDNEMSLIVIHNRSSYRCGTEYESDFSYYLNERIRNPISYSRGSLGHVRKIPHGPICMSAIQYAFGPDLSLIVDQKTDNVLLQKSVDILEDSFLSGTVIYNVIKGGQFMVVLNMKDLEIPSSMQMKPSVSKFLLYWVLNALSPVKYLEDNQTNSDDGLAVESKDRVIPDSYYSRHYSLDLNNPFEFVKVRDYDDLSYNIGNSVKYYKHLEPSLQTPMLEFIHVLYSKAAHNINAFAVITSSDLPYSDYFDDIYYFEPAMIVDLKNLFNPNHASWEKFSDFYESAPCKYVTILLRARVTMLDHLQLAPIYNIDVSVGRGCNTENNQIEACCHLSPFKAPFGFQKSPEYLRVINLSSIAGLSGEELEDIQKIAVTSNELSIIPDGFVYYNANLVGKCKGYLLKELGVDYVARNPILGIKHSISKVEQNENLQFLAKYENIFSNPR